MLAACIFMNMILCVIGWPWDSKRVGIDPRTNLYMGPDGRYRIFHGVGVSHLDCDAPFHFCWLDWRLCRRALSPRPPFLITLSRLPFR